MYNRIKKFYDRGLWTIEQVEFAVLVGVITEEEYKLITDEDYVA